MEVKPSMTINDEIQLMIDDSINQQPKPELVTITAVNTNNTINAKLANGDVLEQISYLGTPTTGNKGILLTLADDTLIIIV